MLRPKWVVGQRTITAVIAPLTLALCMGISHQAMAACTASATFGTNFDCSGVSSSTDPDPNSPPNTVTNNGPNATITGDNGNMAYSLAPDSDFTNSGTTTVTLGGVLGNTAGTQGYQRTRLYGVSGADAGDYQVTNTVTGVITVTHTGTGRMWGVAGNGDATSMTLNNYGLIAVDRSNVTLGAVSATSLTAHGGALANVALDVGAAAYSEEELEEHNIFNAQSGTLRASGLLAGAIFTRAGETTIVNEGLIETSTPTQGFAIGSVSDSGETRSVSLENSGTINGAILMVNGQAQRYFALSTGMGGTFDARLNINSQFGQLDSTITNQETGTITGNLYFGNGTHVLTNEGTITGNIDVEQRMTVISGLSCTVGAAECFADTTTTGQVFQGSPAAEEPSENSAVEITTGAASGNSTTYKLSIWGTKDFSFENAGTMTGNLTVRTSAATTVPYDVPESSVTLLPHIYGGGSTDKTDLDNGASGFIDGTLKIWNGISSTLGDTTTIDPVIDSLVRSGEWYTVATHVFVTGSDKPKVADSVLVEWDVATDAHADLQPADSLAIQATVHDASIVDGLSNPGIATLNALMLGGDGDTEALGGAIQNLKDANDVRVAGEQLAPETNFATQQAALTLNFLTGQYIDNRLGSVGATGGPGGFSAPSGLGMAQTAQASVPKGRMSLGLGTDDGRMNIGANDGRMDAGAYDDDGGRAPRASTGLWGQAFGAGLEQNQRANVDGYDSHIYGALAGVDNWINSYTRLGVAAGYGNTSIDGSGDTARNETDIDSYLGILYGSVKGAGWYATGRLGYAWHDYDTKRFLTVPFSDVATATHTGNQYTAAIEFGSPLRSMMGTLTPVASLNYSRLDQDAYTETSGAGMGLAIGSQETDSLASGLGLKALVPIAAKTLLEARAVWYHEFEDTNQQVTTAFAGGPDFTASGPSVGRDTANVGVGLLAYSGWGTTFQLNYDALLRDDFTAHTGSARLKLDY